MKKFFLVFLLIIVGAAAGWLTVSKMGKMPLLVAKTERVSKNEVDSTAIENTSRNNNTNFVAAAKAVTPAVVHIKSTYDGSANVSNQSYGSNNNMENVPLMASGSGVIISAEGYIATNNHVVENATKIVVILPDRREFIAKLVGRDPTTDLALLKVDASRLPIVRFGNSDNVQVGEWVLAVGYPYSLNTTVTAGIISAKGRSIGILNKLERGASSLATSAIESFIQTDAAINPGNSGGALVNTSGELVGINAAIASLTGSYAGYAFSIPINLAKKVLNDIEKYGTVKRGVLGVSFPAPSQEEQFIKQQGIVPGSVNGVFITGIKSGSAADSSGLKEGDIIQSIDGINMFSSSEFSERIARHNPGDKIQLSFLRNGKTDTLYVTLKDEAVQRSSANNASTIKEIYAKLGARFLPLTQTLKQRFGLSAGVLVTEVSEGGFFDQLGIPPGTIIAYVNGREMYNPQDIENAFRAAGSRRIQILAIAPDGSKVAFSFSFET